MSSNRSNKSENKTKMASSSSNFISILTIALLTFVVLDISNHPSFEKSTTGTTLSYIGVTPYISKAVISVKKTTFYNKQFLPKWNQFVRTVSPHLQRVQREVARNLQLVNVWVKKNTASTIEYIDVTLFPIVKEYHTRYWVIVSRWVSQVGKQVREYSLVASEWVNNNLLGKNYENFQKVLVNWITNFQSTVSDLIVKAQAYVQRLIA